MQVNGMGGGGGQCDFGLGISVATATRDWGLNPSSFACANFAVARLRHRLRRGRQAAKGNGMGNKKDSRRDPSTALGMTLLRPAGYGGQASGGYAGLRRGRFSRGFAALIPGFWTAWRITEGPPCPGPIRVAEKRVFGRFLCPQQGPPHCGTPPQRVPGDGLGGQKIGLFSAVMCTPLRPMA